MKHFLFTSLFLGVFILCSSQGIYTYKPVQVTIQLPPDTGLLARVNRESAPFPLSGFEKDFVYHVNYARQHPDLFIKWAVAPYLAAYPRLQPVYGEGLIKDLGILTQMPPLRVEFKLFSLARLHAADLGKHDFMSHQSSNGITTQQRFEKAGLYCGTECINMGDYPNAVEVLLSLLIDYNVANTGHRKSLLNPKMTSIGVGTARNPSGKLQYTVVDLGCD